MYIGNTNKRQRTASGESRARSRVSEGDNGADMQKSGENSVLGAQSGKTEGERASEQYESGRRRKISLPSPPPNYGGVLYREDVIPDIETEQTDEPDGQASYAEGLTRLARSDRTLRRQKVIDAVASSAKVKNESDCACDGKKGRNSGFEALINGLSHNNFSVSDILFGAVILLMLNGDSDDDMLLILVLMLLL